MTDSILNSTKKQLGLDEDDHDFDLDIQTHINSAFLTLQQIGVGPVSGFFISDAEDEWWDLLGDDPRLNAVKTYVFLRVKNLFDPPQNSFHQSSMDEQIRQFEWRLQVAVEPEPVALPIIPRTDVFAD